MPESPLVQIETVALNDLEALIAARAKGESETELGSASGSSGKRTSTRPRRKQLAAKYKVDDEAMEAEYARRASRSSRRFSATRQATEDEYAQTKQQIDDQFKKEQRKAKKAKEETGWQALAFFEGTRDEGIKWRRATEANWSAAIQELHVNAGGAPNSCSSAAASCARPLPSRGRGSLAERSRPMPRRRRRAEPPRPRQPADRRPRPEPTPAAPASRRAGRATRRATTRSSRLRNDLTRIEDESCIALDALKLPKFLRLELHLAVPAARRRRAAGGPRAGHSDRLDGGRRSRGSSSRRRRRSGPISAWSRWRGPRSRAMPSRSGKPLADAEQLVEQNKDWVKNEFEAKLKEFEEKREPGPRGRGDHGPQRRRGRAARTRSRRRKPTTKYPATARADPHAPRRGPQESRGDTTRPGSTRSRRSTTSDKQQLDESYRKTKETTKQAVRPGLAAT